MTLTIIQGHIPRTIWAIKSAQKGSGQIKLNCLEYFDKHKELMERKKEMESEPETYSNITILTYHIKGWSE